MRMGHNFLRKEFGITPKMAWHADAFGHSMAMNEVFQQMGYEALFFGRMDDLDKKARRKKGEMEFMWAPRYEGEQGEEQSERALFTHVMFNTYSPPCFLKMPSQYERSWMDIFRENQLWEIYSQEKEFMECMNEYADSYPTTHLMWALGDDFTFFDPAFNYEMMQWTMDFVTSRTSRFKFVYSTVEEYYQAAIKEIQEKNITLAEYHDDFLPLQMEQEESFWSGYYTSRPNFKKMIREYSSLTQASNTLFSLDRFRADPMIQAEEALEEELMEAYSLNMHHDTITGTSLTYVVEDTISTLTNGIEDDLKLLQVTIKKILDMFGVSVDQLSLCLR